MYKKVKIFDTPHELSDSFAAEFKKGCDEVISNKGTFNIAISGGSTPKLLFEVLAKDYKNKIDWMKVNIFWVDERCVPPDDEESNFGMTKKILLNKVSLPESNVHRIFGENEPQKEAIRYSEIIKYNLNFKNGFPVFDLILLGVGDDGHTASIFPDQMKLLNSKNICGVAIHPVSRQKRITLTGKIINNAERIYFLVTGKSKAIIISEILNKKDGYLKYPAAHINSDSGNVSWYLDKDAAGLIMGK
ncbi:MAG: 6-phosphogluconolactonase [Bacteroidota bacterium]|nr:6-phosphogluconolactonase [Bacteroidota bacterium]